MTPGVSKTPESLHHPQVKAQEVQGSDLPSRTALGVGMGVGGQGQDLQACPNSESLRASKIFGAIRLYDFNDHFANLDKMTKFIYYFGASRLHVLR